MMKTIDDFLGGKVKLYQSKDGYRATSDSVLLASAVPVRAGQSVLDIGTASGIILFCLNARVGELKLTGIDLQDSLIEMARVNQDLNNVDAEFLLVDLFQKKSPLTGMQFDAVVTNPPFYRSGCGRQNQEQNCAFHEQASIEKWILKCAKYVKAKGSLTLIHQMEALPEILHAFEKTALGGVEVIPLVKDLNTPAKRVIVRGFMGSKKPFLLKNPFVLHGENQEGYSESAEQILRFGAGLDEVL